MFTFPHRIDNMISELLVSPFRSSEEVINEHTMLPFFLPFLGREEADFFVKGTRGDGIGQAATRIFGERTRIEACRYCPECAAEDRKAYKRAYWHRAHLLPGIAVCFRHKVYLEMPKWIVGNRGSSRRYVTADSCIPHDIKARAVDLNDPFQTLLLWLAEQGAWMLTNACEVFDWEKLRAYYKTTISLEGYGRVDSRTCAEFGRIANQRIPPQWLKKLGWPSESGGMVARWVRDIVIRCTGPTVQHLMVLWLLNRTMKDLTKEIGQELVFEKGPWPCLNPTCESHEKEVIEAYRLRTSRDGTLQGSFRCACGFAYRRNGPDKQGATRLNPLYILETGKVWQDKLRELWTDTALPTFRLARNLGVLV